MTDHTFQRVHAQTNSSREAANSPHRKRLLGYTDRLTVGPGETIEFKISAQGNAPYTAQLVRLINGDRHSSARIKELEIESPVNGRYPGREQRIFPGSCVVVEAFQPATPLDKDRTNLDARGALLFNEDRPTSERF